MISLPQQHQQQQHQHELPLQPYSYPADYHREYHHAYTPSLIDLAWSNLDDTSPSSTTSSPPNSCGELSPSRLPRWPSLPISANPSCRLWDPPPAAHNGLADDTSGTSQGSYYHLAKSTGPYPAYQNCGGIEHVMPEMAYPITISGPSGKPRLDSAFILAPDFATGSTRSHPTSVASSIAGSLPATPTVGESDISESLRKGIASAPSGGQSHFLSLGFAYVLKLDRTMTDVYNDELFSPNFAITSTPPSQTQMAVSPSNDLFSQPLHAANSQHLSAAHSPASTTSRGRSPFLAGSPPSSSPSHDFRTGSVAQNMPFNTAQRMREQQDAPPAQQMTQRAEPEMPFSSSTSLTDFPLFPQDPTAFEMDQFSKAMVSQGSQDVAGHDGSSQFNYLHSQLPSGIPVPQQYPFVAHSRSVYDTPPRLSSAGSSSTASRTNTPAHLGRPSGTAAGGGTYTCTYHGCTLRFETPALLQKHKREGHQQTQTLGGPRPRELVGMTSSLPNSQAGPHRCDRVNPSTGKPCSTVFSRPYDLTRHEDTIHNPYKQKMRCNLCKVNTFSRSDALMKHYRVCHPDVELPGKHRRRGDSSRGRGKP